MADGEADDRRAAGASQRHTEEPCLCGDADGFCPTGPDFPGEQVRERRGKTLSVVFTIVHFGKIFY